MWTSFNETFKLGFFGGRVIVRLYVTKIEIEYSLVKRAYAYTLCQNIIYFQSTFKNVQHMTYNSILIPEFQFMRKVEGFFFCQMGSR